MRHHLIVCAGIVGLLGVVAGTFGAHLFKDKLTPEMLAVFETGVRYHVYHALALLGVAGVMRKGASRLLYVGGWAFVVGVVLFCGSLYVLALTGEKWWGRVAPVGGIAFMAGWLLVAMGGWRSRKPKPGERADVE